MITPPTPPQLERQLPDVRDFVPFTALAHSTWLIDDTQ